ncbi:hypothetical protein G6F61_000530 [Rhizopus arrhizus]|nr:hypothetical protein G6F61_000530 [Rhizopus arrhizus]
MSNAIVANVYRYVIDEVINQVRGDFEDMGIDESVLQELQRSWESKVARSRVANFGFVKDDTFYDDEHPDQQGLNGGHDNEDTESNNHPILQYPSNQEYTQSSDTTPSAASLATLAANSSRVQQQHHHQQQQQQQQQPHQQQSNFGLPPPPRMISDPSTLVNPYHMMQSSLANNGSNNTRPQNNNSNSYLPDLQLPGIPKPNLPQNDGACDELLTTEEIDRRIEDIIQSNQDDQEENSITFSATSFSGEPISLDSLPINVKQLMIDAKEKAMKKNTKTRLIPQLDGEGDDEGGDEDDINSDLDDTDDEDEEGEGGEEIEHIILCLYDKVTRTKNKWKCVLKDGIMLVNGRDYLFHRATGDFEW